MIKLDEQEKRIAVIFDEYTPPEVSYDNLSRYLAYLNIIKNSISLFKEVIPLSGM